MGSQQEGSMNIVSYNVRGLGRGVKWAAIRRMIKKEGAEIQHQYSNKRNQRGEEKKSKQIEMKTTSLSKLD